MLNPPVKIQKSQAGNLETAPGYAGANHLETPDSDKADQTNHSGLALAQRSVEFLMTDFAGNVTGQTPSHAEKKK